MQAVTSQLPLVHMDDCFITLCPGNQVLQQDPPSFEAECAPLDKPTLQLSAVTGGAVRPLDMLQNCAAGDDDTCLHLLAPLSILLMLMLSFAGFLLFKWGTRAPATAHKRRSSGVKHASLMDIRCTVRQPLIKHLHFSESSAGHSSGSVSATSSPMTAASSSTSGTLSTPFSQAKHD